MKARDGALFSTPCTLPGHSGAEACSPVAPRCCKDMPDSRRKQGPVPPGAAVKPRSTGVLPAARGSGGWGRGTGLIGRKKQLFSGYSGLTLKHFSATSSLAPLPGYVLEEPRPPTHRYIGTRKRAGNSAARSSGLRCDHCIKPDSSMRSRRHSARDPVWRQFLPDRSAFSAGVPRRNGATG